MKIIILIFSICLCFGFISTTNEYQTEGGRTINIGENQQKVKYEVCDAFRFIVTDRAYHCYGEPTDECKLLKV